MNTRKYKQRWDVSGKGAEFIRENWEANRHLDDKGWVALLKNHGLIAPTTYYRDCVTVLSVVEGLREKDYGEKVQRGEVTFLRNSFPPPSRDTAHKPCPRCGNYHGAAMPKYCSALAERDAARKQVEELKAQNAKMNAIARELCASFRINILRYGLQVPDGELDAFLDKYHKRLDDAQHKEKNQ